MIKAMPSDRLFLRKVGKAMDKQAFKLAVTKRKIQGLEASLEHIRATKKKRVEIDPNKLFTTVGTVREAQRKVGRMPLDSDDSPEEEDQEDIHHSINVL